MNIDKSTVRQGKNWSSRKERTLGFMGELNQFLVPRLKNTPPGSWRLRTEPNSGELGPKSPPRGPSPHSMELIFGGEALLAPPADESIDNIKGLVIPCFKPFGVVESEEFIVW